ncbi:MAG: XTP/dITP diphosphatase [Candidatus Hadarchaeia archaeon]
MKLSFVTSNEGKFREAKEIGSRYDLEMEHLSYDYTEIQADTLEEIAKLGAKEAFEAVSAPCFVEDAGLFVYSLNGFPGPYSSYVYKTIGNSGILRLMKGQDHRKSEFKSVVCYYDSEVGSQIFIGTVEGKIVQKERGSGGFGYDPIFEPERCGGKTFAEMTVKSKNDLSHRARSIEKFVKWYVENKKAGD